MAATNILTKLSSEDKEEILDKFFAWYKKECDPAQKKYLYPYPMIAIAEECCEIYNDYYKPKHKAFIGLKGLK